MSRILDIVGAETRFSPTKPQEYLAFQIAKKLNDLTAIRHYLVLFEHYPEDLLISTFRCCLKKQHPTGEDFMRVFREVTGQAP